MSETMEVTYSDKLRDPRWQKRRLQVFEKAGWKCECCGDDKATLHVHHLVYTGKEPWKAKNSELECLCWECHEWREYFNEFWGRSKLPTSFCKHFMCIFRPLFDGEVHGWSFRRSQSIFKFHWPGPGWFGIITKTYESSDDDWSI